MIPKTILTKYYILILFNLLLLSPLFAQNSFHFDALVSVNFSHPIASPINETEKGQTYSVHYIPGYDWAGIISYERNRVTIGIGIGYKNINFNHVRNFIKPEFPYGHSFTKSMTIARLHYLCIPVQSSIMLNHSKGIFISLSTEFCKLCNDIFYEVASRMTWPQILYRNELFQSYEKNLIFLYIGTGMRISPNTKFVFELGYTPETIDKNQEILNKSYHNFLKKIVSLRVTFSYELFCIEL